MFETDDISIKRVAVFEVEKDKRKYYANQKHSLDINESDDKYVQPVGILKANIRKKIMSKESRRTTSTNATESVIRISAQSMRGAKAS